MSEPNADELVRKRLLAWFGDILLINRTKEPVTRGRERRERPRNKNGDRAKGNTFRENGHDGTGYGSSGYHSTDLQETAARRYLHQIPFERTLPEANTSQDSYGRYHIDDPNSGYMKYCPTYYHQYQQGSPVLQPAFGDPFHAYQQPIPNPVPPSWPTNTPQTSDNNVVSNENENELARKRWLAFCGKNTNEPVICKDPVHRKTTCELGEPSLWKLASNLKANRGGGTYKVYHVLPGLREALPVGEVILVPPGQRINHCRRLGRLAHEELAARCGYAVGAPVPETDNISRLHYTFFKMILAYLIIAYVLRALNINLV